MKPTVQAISVAILHASSYQVKSSPVWREVVDCGLGGKVMYLLEQVAGSAHSHSIFATLKPSVQDVFVAILQASVFQVDDLSPTWQEVVDCGLDLKVRDLIEQIAANATNPIVDMFDDNIMDSNIGRSVNR